MSQDVRDLRSAGLYLFALAGLALGLMVGGAAIADRVSASSVFASVVSVFETDSDPAPTHLSISVARAREVRAALAKPLPPLEPLPPITATLAYGHLKNARSSSVAAQYKVPKLPAAALNAMASTNFQTSAPASSVELHKVY